MATQQSNNYKYRLLRGEIHFHTDTFKGILMGANFVYNPAVHATYNDVNASQLATGFGYTAGGATLTNVSVTKDDVNNKGRVTWNNVSWNAAGGDIGPAVGVIIYDDTEATKTVIGFLDFGSQKTTLNGGVFTVGNLFVDQL